MTDFPLFASTVPVFEDDWKYCTKGSCIHLLNTATAPIVRQVYSSALALIFYLEAIGSPGRFVRQHITPNLVRVNMNQSCLYREVSDVPEGVLSSALFVRPSIF